MATPALDARPEGTVFGMSPVVAAVVTPTPDPVTMIVTMAPLILLYEMSIVLAWIFRPRGDTITSRWGDWWDDEDDDEGPGPDDQEPREHTAGAGDAPARVS